MASYTEEIRRQLAESARVKQAFSDALIARMAEFAQRSAPAIRRGGKLVFFGNGGSAPDAQHLAAELVVRLRTQPPPLPPLPRPTTTSAPTAPSTHLHF